MTRFCSRILLGVLLALVAHDARAAIAIDATASTDRSTSASAIASPAFSTAAGSELLLAFVATDGSAPGTTVTGVTGAGQTWTLVVRTNAQSGTAEIWRAFAAAPLANATVTAALSQSVGATITVVSLSGVDPSGAGGAGAIGAVKSSSAASGPPSASLVTTRANSWVFGVGNDWDAAVARTVGAGQTLVHQYLATIGDTYWTQRTTVPTPAAGTTVTLNDTAPSADRFNLSICEILPASGGSSDTTPPVVSITAPAGGASVAGTVTVSATASDNVGVASVQFRLDGANLGAPITAAPYAVSWNTVGADGPHTLTAVAADAAGNATTSAPVNVVATNGAQVTGAWGAPFDLGIVAVNTVLMHTGKVLMFSGTYASSFVERVWDPATGSITLVPNPFYDVFCAGQTQLADGRILVVGGFDSATLGAPNANIFDPATLAWSALPNMAYRRWYPTATTLPDGRVLVTSGGQTCLTCLADVPEIFDPATGRFSTLPSARLAVPYYPFMFVLPDGTVIDAGANEETVATSKLDVTAGHWTTVDPVVRDGHSAAMYRPGQILKSGTAADSGTMGNAAPTAFVLDATQPTPSWRQVASMANPRAFHNTTLLPDGTVLVTGGGTTLDGHDIGHAVRVAELWSPATETWQTLATASVPRLYHSTALLLPDGRVLTAGGGNDFGAVDETQGEIFSPPYLFKGARPTIAGAPALVQYGAPFTVQTPDAATIASVALIHPGAPTHAFDEAQRFLDLAFTAGSGSLSIEAPANANLAPPGYYMLFLVNTSGVPSVAAFVQLPSPAQDTIPPSAPTGLSGAGAIGTATLTWNASTDNTGVALYNVHRSTTAGFTPSSANRVGQSASTTFTDNPAAGSYFYAVTAQDVAGNVSAPSIEVSVVVLADTTAPSVSITSPIDQQTVSGSLSIAATASDDVGVVGVQFELDGGALGTERTAAPYTITWNTATTSNGPHVLTAVARDGAGNVTTAAAVHVTVSNSSQVPPGLVAAYAFGEGSGVQTADASGQGNTGTISGATWTASGRFGSALSFNGTNAWVTIANSGSLDVTTGFTLEAWVNPSAGSAWRTVVLKEAPGGLSYSLYAANGASRPAAFVHIASDLGATGTSAVPLNTWTHLAATFDGATLRLYANGVLVGSAAASGSALVSGSSLRIGGNSIWGEYFKGIIDEVRIYNRALSAGEIQTDMTTPVQ